MKIKDFYINSYKIRPPIGGEFAWGAKATILTEEGTLQLGERWGRTKEEAEVRANESVKEAQKQILRKKKI